MKNSLRTLVALVTVLICLIGSQGFAEKSAADIAAIGKAAVQGDAKAQYDLGLHYKNGNGVPEDDAEAVKWYRKAAEQGYAGAQNNLGVCYDHGQGVPRDDVLAYMWFDIAGASGYERAETNKKVVSLGMNSEQIAEAQKLSREWKTKNQ